jgi:hypothetical protein
MMRMTSPLQSPVPGKCPLRCGMRIFALLFAVLLSAIGLHSQQTAPGDATTTPKASPSHKPHSRSSSTHKSAHRSHSVAALKTKKPVVSAPVAAVTPAPPPGPNWPVNDHPNHAAVVWDSQGLRIEAQNSSLQQILRDVAVETGAKIEGMGADQRVYGAYGPGQARDVLSQLLIGSGYNVLLAGDLGQGAPRQIVLSPRRAGATTSATAGQPTQEANGEEDAPDNEVEEQPEPQQPLPTQLGAGRPGFGPNGPVRTPQQVMEEMQQRQLQQQQEQQQQQQQQGSPTNPQN